jgi:2-iminobutanoate/2-iminopropanoate deaminase
MASSISTCAVSGKQLFQLHGFEADWGYAQAVRAGPFIFVSGSVSIGSDGRPLAADDMPAQVANAYASIVASLAAFGAGLSHVVQEKLVTTDLERFMAEGATARAEAYAGHSLPASSAWTQTPRLAQPEFLFEVEAIAYLPPTAREAGTLP